MSVCQEFGKDIWRWFGLLCNIWDLSRKDLKIQPLWPRIIWDIVHSYFWGLMPALIQKAYRCGLEFLTEWTPLNPYIGVQSSKGQHSKETRWKLHGFYDLASEVIWCQFHYNLKQSKKENTSPTPQQEESQGHCVIRLYGKGKLDLVTYGKYNLAQLPCKWSRDKT